MKISKTMIIIGIIVALGACESTHKKDEAKIMASGVSPLSSEEIREALIGNSVYERGISRKGHAYEYQGFYAGGSVTGRSWGDGWDESDTASWEATEDNQYCRQWVKWAEAKRGCFEIYRLSDTQIGFKAVSGEAKTGISELKMGNAYSL